MTIHRYSALRANQADGRDVFVFSAKAKDILSFAQIDRVGRSDDGKLKGFQRHQISSHIRDIRDYLRRDDAILPNAVIVAFMEGAKLKELGQGRLEVRIDDKNGPPGFVVDGQQRLTALSGIDKPDFEVLVSAVLCKSYDDLRQQFVLVNTTRPLPKALIYELLPTVEGLPERYTARRFAAKVVERLNFSATAALRGQIRQHTNPTGVISDTAMQKLVMNSAAHGAIRDLIQFEDREDRAVHLVGEYFDAVAEVFGGEWTGMSPRHSRLRHGAGIVASGFVMDLLYGSSDARKKKDFLPALNLLKPHTAWTAGTWSIGDTKYAWNDIQNTPSDIDLLSRYLVSTTKRELRRQEKLTRQP